jgi:hypothetical protein
MGFYSLITIVIQKVLYPFLVPNEWVLKKFIDFNFSQAKC